MKRQEIGGNAELMRCLVSSENKELILNAAKVNDVTYSKFMIDASVKEARRILRHKSGGE